MSENERNREHRSGRAQVYSGGDFAMGENVRRPRRNEYGERLAGNGEKLHNREEKPKRQERNPEEKPKLQERNPEERQKRPERSRGTESGGWQEKLKHRKRKRLRRILYGVGIVLIAAYVVVAVYFSFHFYSGTLVYGVDCEKKTAGEVKLEVKDKLGEYFLEIQEREGKTERISADEIDLQYVDNGSIDRLLKEQRAYIWPVTMVIARREGTSISFSYDKEMAEAVLNSLDCMDSISAVAPRDAYIAATDTGFEVVDEVMGTTLDRERTRQVVLEALDRGDVSVSLEEEECYINPQIYHDNEELQSDAAEMSKRAGAYITYEFGDQTEVVNAAVIRDWLVKLDDGTFVVDDMCVSDYVESLAAKYDTFGLPLDFYTSIGTTVTLSGGDYGWCIDQSSTVVALLNALEEGYRGTMEPVYLYSAMSHENQGIGYTYVEICISQQRMWCYQDGNVIVDTPVVTGNPNKGNATPSGGVWAIDAKKRDAVLTGEGYTAPVSYWMPFNGNVGIHDMERYAFGGTIYLSNGSHGCINTPYDQAEIIYNTVSIGTPVIVYE